MKRIEIVKEQYNEKKDNDVIYQNLSNYILNNFDYVKGSIERHTDYMKTTIEQLDYGELSEVNADIYRKVKRYFESEENEYVHD